MEFKALVLTCIVGMAAVIATTESTVEGERYWTENASMHNEKAFGFDFYKNYSDYDYYFYDCVYFFRNYYDAHYYYYCDDSSYFQEYPYWLCSIMYYNSSYLYYDY